MGRGRAKAKQTKVARDLKYRSVGFDSASLERELRGESGQVEGLYDEIPDQYADLMTQYDDDDLVAYEEDDEDRR
ncbi:MAG: DUF3073 domain-containing protein [Brooklawnia sp.]